MNADNTEIKNVLVVGALSDMAQAVCKKLATRHYRFFLLARNSERLGLLANDLTVRGAAWVGSAVCDVTHIEEQSALLLQAQEALGQIDWVLVAHGTLPDQKVCETDVPTLIHELNTNATSSLVLLSQLANLLEAQGHGTLGVITSVAGDRGRQSNYVYGAAKACVTTFLQGLRNRLFKKNVHVLTIKPGFVSTAMTRQFKKGALWVSAETAATVIVRAFDQQKDVAYVPRFWALIMWVIKHIPEVVFKRLRL